MWKKGTFRYTEYEKRLIEQGHSSALEYSTSFSGDKNAVICSVYSQNCLLQSGAGINTSFQELNADIVKVVDRSSKSWYKRYDKNALFLLGLLLFRFDNEIEGREVLKFAASLEKRNDKLSDVEKQARFFLEQYHFQKWLDTNQQAELKWAADCFGHSEVCFLYADVLRDMGGDRDEADTYEFCYAVDYCASYMSKEDYNRRHIEKHLDLLTDSIQKDLGFIASGMVMMQYDMGRIGYHVRAIERKVDELVDELPELICNALQTELKEVYAPIDELSNSMQERDKLLEALFMKSSELVSEAGNEQEILLKEIRELVQKADKIEDNIEAYFQTISKSFESVLQNITYREVQEIIDNITGELHLRFGNRLWPELCHSIRTAWFFLSVGKKLKKTQNILFDYSGVVMLATGALEKAIVKKLFTPYMDFLKAKYNMTCVLKHSRWGIPADAECLTSFPNKQERLERKTITINGRKSEYQLLKERFTLGDLIYLVGIRGKDKEIAEGVFKEYIKTISDQISLEDYSIFYQYNQKYPPEKLRNFTERINELRYIRNEAAHSGNVSYENAKKICDNIFLCEESQTENVGKNAVSLMGMLLYSFKD